MAKKKATYTYPELRERPKEETKASDEGSRPGQWSVHKAQFLSKEYEKAGGYKEWTIRDKEEQARRGDETARYLSKEAWEN